MQIGKRTWCFDNMDVFMVDIEIKSKNMWCESLLAMFSPKLYSWSLMLMLLLCPNDLRYGIASPSWETTDRYLTNKESGAFAILESYNELLSVKNKMPNLRISQALEIV